MITNNPCLKTDSYKPSHWPSYPEDTCVIDSYFESRGGAFKEVVFFGLQYIMMNHLITRVTREHVDEATAFYDRHLLGDRVFNRDGWLAIVDELGGRIPLSIRAVPEGSVVPVSNILMRVVNTAGHDKRFAWITNWWETILAEAWYPCTVATISRESKKIIRKYMLETGGSDAGLEYKLHDFGFRGSTCMEAAGIGGAAHLVNFKGSDTIPGILVAAQCYGEPMAGVSIPATEHSVITSFGREREVEAYRRHILRFRDHPVYACVMDSYDVFNAAKILGTELREDILAGKGTFVFRPDSGNPQEIVPKVLDILGHYFGTTTTDQGFKLLNPKIRVIQGDGITVRTLDDILATMKFRGWAADNVAFGMGAGLLQKCDRDTQKFAFKCSYTENTYGAIDVFKDPVTQSDKKSKRGRLKLIRTNTGFQTVREDDFGDDLLVEVYRDGEILKTWTFDEIRARATL